MSQLANTSFRLSPLIFFFALVFGSYLFMSQLSNTSLLFSPLAPKKKRHVEEAYGFSVLWQKILLLACAQKKKCSFVLKQTHTHTHTLSLSLLPFLSRALSFSLALSLIHNRHTWRAADYYFLSHSLSLSLSPQTHLACCRLLFFRP